MRRINYAILLLSLLAFAGQTASQTKTARKPSYEELVAKLKNGDTTINYRDLRMAYAETKGYSPNGGDREALSKMFAVLNENKFKDALQAAENILKTNYVEMNAHFAAAVANNQLGDKIKSDFHKAVFLGLFNSVLRGSDGKSAKTAFEVIGTSEEYVVMNRLGYRTVSQALVDEGGHKYDVLTGTNSETNETVKFYFNIDTIWKNYGNMLGK